MMTWPKEVNDKEVIKAKPLDQKVADLILFRIEHVMLFIANDVSNANINKLLCFNVVSHFQPLFITFLGFITCKKK